MTIHIELFRVVVAMKKACHLPPRKIPVYRTRSSPAKIYTTTLKSL